MNKKHEIVGNIYKTEDYSIFKRLEGNRDVLSRRVLKIKKNIETHGYILNPIIVNENNEIIDGQGRFEALKELSMPIYYVIARGASLEDCVALNAGTTGWTTRDYIDSWCEQDNINYIRLNTIIEEYKKLPLQLAIMITTGRASIPQDSIKNGSLVISEEQIKEAKKDLDLALKAHPYISRIRGTNLFHYYALIFAAKTGADKKRLIDVISRSDLFPAQNVRTALDKLSDLYNKGLKNLENRIYLYPKYEALMLSKYGWYENKYIEKYEEKKEA